MTHARANCDYGQAVDTRKPKQKQLKTRRFTRRLPHLSIVHKVKHERLFVWANAYTPLPPSTSNLRCWITREIVLYLPSYTNVWIINGPETEARCQNHHGTRHCNVMCRCGKRILSIFSKHYSFHFKPAFLLMQFFKQRQLCTLVFKEIRHHTFLYRRSITTWIEQLCYQFNFSCTLRKSASLKPQKHSPFFYVSQTTNKNVHSNGIRLPKQ